MEQICHNFFFEMKNQDDMMKMEKVHLLFHQIIMFGQASFAETRRGTHRIFFFSFSYDIISA